MLASDRHTVPPWLRKDFDDLNVKMGLLFLKEQLMVPLTLEEWVLQVLHGNHAGQMKMQELARNLCWRTKQHDIEEKASNCLICFKAGKNLKPINANNKINRDIPKPVEPGEELQIDFAGPFIDQSGRKKFVLVVVDSCSRWPSAKLTFQKYMKTFLIENNQMDLAMKKTLKVMRYSLHRSIGRSPFQKHFGRPHNSEINELLC